ncbi:MAG: hypothetical protein IKM04_06195 [Clostridia bacterium]|nr:hypothetical protein [Clostridia bacterium]
MVYANDFVGKNDSEILNNAIKNRGSDGVVIIPPRTVDSERSYWLLDEAIVLPENTTVVLQNVKIKLSDNCRDNFFRSANCGLGIERPARIRNIHIHGEGVCLLEGADHPRASGDSSKLLHAPCPHFPEDVCRVADWVPAERRSPDKLDFWDVHDHSYGTDAGKTDRSQYGDWRGIGVLFANVEDFSISGLRIKESHGWGISLEACSNGRIEKIDFDAHMYKMIDGMNMNMENQDGIDVRNGCHHIVISDITGTTGDDVVALTAIASDSTYVPGGSLYSTHVMPNDWENRDRDIHDIVIRNVIAYSHICLTVRLLPAMANIYNVVIDGIIDTSPEIIEHGVTILLGDDGGYGENMPDSMRNVTISNVICHSRQAVVIAGFLTDSVISNVVNRNPDCEAVLVVRKDGLKNVVVADSVVTRKN